MLNLKFIANISRFYHTVKHLKPKQIAYRLYYKLPKVKINQHISAIQFRSPAQQFSPFIKKNHNDNLTFLNKTEKYSDTIWNDQSIEKLWLYNLHYFDYLSLTTSRYIHRWLENNPINQGVGWEAYPLSLRIVNWIKYSLNGGEFSKEAINSLYLQSRALTKKIEHHILGNHIFENYKALCFVGLFFDGAEADSWFNTGFKGLKKEIKEQILEDGGHFELSPMYHSIILEDMLDIVNVFRTYGKRVPEAWLEKINKMRYWLEVMCHPDGEISFFNDATFGIAPSKQALNDYSLRLGLPHISHPEKEIIHLKDSGYVRINKDDLYLLIDVGRVGPSYQPGHAHADTLSYEVSYQSKRVVVNSGIDRYGLSDERLYQRSTQAHNATVVDEKNSSDVWSGFRVGKRALPKDLIIDQSGISITCSHTGYKHLMTRKFTIQNNEIKVEDSCIGELASYIHLCPDASIHLESENEYKVQDDQWFPAFGISIPSKQLVVKTSNQLSYVLKFNYIV